VAAIAAQVRPNAIIARLGKSGSPPELRDPAAGDCRAAAVGVGVITALVLLNVEPGRVKSLAEELLEVAGVTECYSVAGPYDLVAIVRVREHDQLSDLVTEKIASHAGINATETLIAFRSFAKRDLGMVWDIGAD
jgi:DNA-binding Lrp family transcriptional regulator